MQAETAKGVRFKRELAQGDSERLGDWTIKVLHITPLRVKLQIQRDGYPVRVENVPLGETAELELRDMAEAN